MFNKTFFNYSLFESIEFENLNTIENITDFILFLVMIIILYMCLLLNILKKYMLECYRTIGL